MLDEIRMVDERCRRVAEDVNELKAKLELQVEKTVKMINENIDKQVEKQVMIAKEELGREVATAAFKTVGVAVVVVSSLVWLWTKV